MINKNILHEKLMDKFSNLTFHAIVNECFINSLPMNQNEITPEEKISLSRFSYNVVKAIGGISAIESAVDFNGGKTLSQNLFLANIYNVCMESAKLCTKRAEADAPRDSEVAMATIVDKASMTESEYKNFVKKADNMDLDKVSKIIKDKTIAVIKDEQEQYEKEIELDEELKDALADSKSYSDKTVESYMDMFLDKTAPRHHVTLFSKLQETAMEMMSVTKVGDNGSDIFPIIEKVTTKTFFNSLDKSVNFDSVTESMQKITTEEVCEIPVENRGKMATLVSIIVYNIMETLKTMGIYSPSQADVRKIVNSNVDGNAIAQEDKQNIYNKAKMIVKEANIVDFSKMNSSDLSNKLVELKSIYEMAQESLNNNVNDQNAVSLMTDIDTHISEIESIMHSRHKEIQQKSMATESYSQSFDKSTDVASFNRISNMYASKPTVSEIRLRLDPKGISSIIDVECANESSQIVQKSFVNLRYACESDQYISYIKETIEKSKLSTCGKKISVLINDGKSTKITL